MNGTQYQKLEPSLGPAGPTWRRPKELRVSSSLALSPAYTCAVCHCTQGPFNSTSEVLLLYLTHLTWTHEDSIQANLLASSKEIHAQESAG